MKKEHIAPFFATLAEANPQPVTELVYTSVFELLVASSDDPYCSLERAHELAAHWGARFAPAGACGHMNAESALGLWPQGQALLRPLMNGTSED